VADTAFLQVADTAFLQVADHTCPELAKQFSVLLQQRNSNLIDEFLSSSFS